MPRRSRRPDGQAPRAILRRTILQGWDFWIGLAVGLIVFVAGLFPAILPFDTTEHLPLWPFATILVVLSLGVWLGERWLADRIAGTDYGELVGMVDPDNSSLLLPYQVVAVTAFLGAIANALATLIAPQVDAQWAHGLIYGLAAFLTAWAVVGFIELLFITSGHMRRQAEVRSLREQWEAEQRMRERNGT